MNQAGGEGGPAFILVLPPLATRSGAGAKPDTALYTVPGPFSVFTAFGLRPALPLQLSFGDLQRTLAPHFTEKTLTVID